MFHSCRGIRVQVTFSDGFDHEAASKSEEEASAAHAGFGFNSCYFILGTSPEFSQIFSRTVTGPPAVLRLGFSPQHILITAVSGQAR